MGRFIGARFKDAPEESVLPEQEYELRLLKTDSKETNAKDRDMLVAIIGVEGHPEAQSIFENMCLPNEKDWEEDDGRVAQLFLRRMRRFFEVFGIPYTEDGFDEEDFLGATGNTGKCLVGLGEDMNGDECNVLKLPRIDE